MKKSKIKTQGFMLGTICIICGLTSFSNHPDWGIWVSISGTLIILLTILFQPSYKNEK